MPACLLRYLGIIASSLRRSTGRFVLGFSSAVLIPAVVLTAVGVLIFRSPPVGISASALGVVISFSGPDSPSLLIGWLDLALLAALGAALGIRSAVGGPIGGIGLPTASAGAVSAAAVTTCCTIAPAPLVSFLGAAAAAASSAALAAGLRCLGVLLLAAAAAYYLRAAARSVAAAAGPACSRPILSPPSGLDGRGRRAF